MYMIKFSRCTIFTRYHPKIIEAILNNVQKESTSVLMMFMINGNENEA